MWQARRPGPPPPHGSLQVAGRLGRRRGHAKTICNSAPQLIALLEHPVVVEAGQQLGGTAIQRRLQVAGYQQPLDLIHVRPNLGSQRNATIARGDQHCRGRLPERGTHLRQRCAQAHPRTVLTHVGPQASGQLAAAVHTPVDRQHGQQQLGLTAERHQLGVHSIDLQPKVAKEVQTHHVEGQPTPDPDHR
jgi:hypothetical protein